MTDQLLSAEYGVFPEPDGGSLLGRRALVVGAGTPVGRAVASAYFAAGARVSAHDGSIGDAAAAAALIAQTAGRLGGIDLLVLVPQAPATAEVASHPLDRTMALNVYPLFWLSRAAAPYLAAGSVIVTTNLVDGFGSEASFAEATAGIETITTGLARRFERAGVRVNSVTPGSNGADTSAVASAYVNAATTVQTGRLLVA